VDLVFHLAADVSVPQSMQEPQNCFDVNVQGTLHILDASRKQGVRQVVLASSCAVYGDSENIPLSESEPPRPLSPYAASKQVDEVYARMYTKIYDQPVIALRYFNVYGPRQSPDSIYAAVIPVFIKAMLNGKSPTIYGDGKQSRDFVNVRDVVRANLLAAENPQVAGRVFNICTGQETNLLDLMQTLGGIMPDAPGHIHTSARPGDIYRSLGDPKEAAQGLGFKAEVSLKDGLVQIVKWMQT
jgi:UDP-glucose 4-epimerase